MVGVKVNERVPRRYGTFEQCRRRTVPILLGGWKLDGEAVVLRSRGYQCRKLNDTVLRQLFLLFQAKLVA